jgi:hypothetical protein
MIKWRRIRLVANIIRMGREKERNTYILLAGKPDVKRPLGGRRRRRVDNIKIDIGLVLWTI